MDMRFNNNRRAFTLIELLVVISIISLLMSVLIPALSKARESGKILVCASNLRQWGLSFSMYENDYKGRLPMAYTSSTTGAWYHINTMGAYLPTESYENSMEHDIIVKGVALCPSHLEGKKSDIGRSYSFNYRISYPESQNFDNYSIDFKTDTQKSKRVVLADGSHDRPGWAATETPEFVSFVLGNKNDINYARHGKDREKGKANILFGDWHVDKAQKDDDIRVYRNER